MVYRISNSIILDNLRRFRDKNTEKVEAWKCVEYISFFLAGEISNLLDSTEMLVNTPLGESNATCLDSNIELVPVLRAGFAMLRPFQMLFPNAHIGPIACQRMSDLSIEVRYDKISERLDNKTVIVLDTMLATGNTINKVIELLKERNAHRVIIATILSVKTGIDALSNYEIFTIDSNDTLDENYYIYPGVGDSGDRLFGSINN